MKEIVALLERLFALQRDACAQAAVYGQEPETSREYCVLLEQIQDVRTLSARIAAGVQV